MLAAPSTPNDVRAEVERRAIDGESITVAEIARLKAAQEARTATAKADADRKATEAKAAAEADPVKEGEELKRAKADGGRKGGMTL